MSKVAILGSGPAGLIAAATCAEEGVKTIDIFTDAIAGKSPIGGAQYLHQPLEVDAEPDGEIEFVKVGGAQGYADKIYSGFETDTSWEDYDGTHLAWSLRPVYDALWTKYEDRIRHKVFDGMELVTLAHHYDGVFSSIPRAAICLAHDSHSFQRVPIVLAKFSPIAVPNVVMYSGRDEDPWYRTSRIFGEGWTEFGAGAIAKAPFDDELHLAQETVPGFKPLGTNCTCHPDVTMIGRFGNWDRKVLLHHVPDQVRAAL